jgi:SEC-C motif
MAGSAVYPYKCADILPVEISRNCIITGQASEDTSMPDMPAFCGSCGLVFPSGFVIENSTGISPNNVQSQCPRCGGMARVPDGMYNVLGQVIEFLAGPTSSLDQLRRLQASLETARNKQEDRDEIRKAILETAPELTGLASALPANRVELYAFITVVLALLTLLVSTYTALKPSGPTQAEIDAMVNKAIEKATYTAPPKAAIATPHSKRPKVGRNQPCPCGSGKKYKKCCLEAKA